MTADRLLWMYPKTWRERYGDEFLEMLGGRDLLFSQMVDIVVGAVDARLFRSVPTEAPSEPIPRTAEGGAGMTTLFATTAARNRQPPFGSRQGALGAIVLIVAYNGLKALADLLEAQGWLTTGRFVFYASFPVVAILYLNFTVLYEQPPRPRVVLVVGALGLVALMAGLAAR